MNQPSIERSIVAQFIKNELDAYIQTQRVHSDQVVVNLIIKAFEAYEEYKRLVSPPPEESITVAYRDGRDLEDYYKCWPPNP